jgi:hypothetical protein
MSHARVRFILRTTDPGHYEPTAFAGYESQHGAKLTDIQHPGGATGFWVSDFAGLAIIDLDGPK